ATNALALLLRGLLSWRRLLLGAGALLCRRALLRSRPALRGGLALRRCLSLGRRLLPAGAPFRAAGPRGAHLRRHRRRWRAGHRRGPDGARLLLFARPTGTAVFVAHRSSSARSTQV